MITYDIDEFAEVVKREGLEYTIIYYINPEGITDTKLRELVKQAARALDKIEEYLKENLGDDWE